MNVISLCPFRVGSVLWQSSRGGWAVTVVCKATYRLVPDECPLSPEQEPVNDDDKYRGDDPSGSLLAPTDLVPFKPRADVMLVGQAFAPGGRPARALVARLVVVGALEKAIHVSGARAWTPTGELLEGTGFTSMPLSYEHAAGGPATWNPVGMRPDAPPDAKGNVAIPSLLPATRPAPAARGAEIEPVGFGPVAPGWPGRSELLGPHKASWSPTTWHHRPLPEGLDPRFFNAAPPDQQIDELRGDERIILENLHPELPQIVTRLPGLHPRAFVERPGAAPRELALRCDTLWINTDRALCTVTWRGQLPLESRAETGRALVVMDEPGQRSSWAEVERMSRALTSHLQADPAYTMQLGHDIQPKAPLPFGARAHGDPGEVSRQAAGAEARYLRESATDSPHDATKPPIRRSSPHLPFVTAPPAMGDAGQPASGMTPPQIAPPPMMRAPAPAEPIAPPSSPWAAKEPLAPGLGVGKSPDRSPDAPPPIPPKGPASAKIDGRDGRDGRKAGPDAAAIRGAGAASNAAAMAGEKVERSAAQAQRPTDALAGERPREALELLYYDPEALPRVRRHLPWKKIITELKPRPSDDDFDGGLPPKQTKDAKDKRDIFGVLARGEVVDMAGVRRAMEMAVADDGSFVPPYVLTAGALELQFDEVAVLRATMIAVAPFAASDKKLKDTIDLVEDVLKTQGIDRARRVAEGLTTRVRQAFEQTNRGVPASYLDSQTEPILLEGLAERHYQKRVLLGKQWIRGLFTPTGSQGQVPLYLPERLEKKLPIFRRLKIRAIVEVRSRLDQYELEPTSLRLIAAARVLSLQDESV